MNAEQCKDMFLAVADKIIDSEDYLTKIDEQIGDGDHGSGMALGFENVKQELSKAKVTSVEDVFRITGTTLLDIMGGASGVLFGTVFISGIAGRDPENDVGLKQFAEIFRKSLEALKRRGKANIGDKTMVDAFEPAVVALEESVTQNDGLTAGLRKAAEAAKKGMENTKKYQARFGRARYFGKKAIGLQDAGATSIWLIFQEMADWVELNG